MVNPLPLTSSLALFALPMDLPQIQDTIHPNWQQKVFSLSSPSIIYLFNPTVAPPKQLSEGSIPGEPAN